MLVLPEEPSRDEVLRYISASASYGNLGLFVGAGLSKAVLNTDDDYIALSWGELLERAARHLDVDYDSIEKVGLSYPEIATRICSIRAEEHGNPYNEVVSDLKRIVADCTCWYPDQERRERFVRYFDDLSPAWVITTNYDLVLETLLTGKSLPLGPNDHLTSPRDVVPIYHLHGIRTSPEELVLTQEDYVSLFRPNEYRQIKLALTIKESTTLLLGYGLGDVNVLTALDWSYSVFTGEASSYPHAVVQVVRKLTPRLDPYRATGGILILESKELTDFFDEFAQVRQSELQREQRDREKLIEVSRSLSSPDQETIDRFIDDDGFRQEIIAYLASFPIHLAAGFTAFFDKCIDATWRRSVPYGAFRGYTQNLKLILDILTGFDVSNIPPALFQVTAYALNRVGPFVGNEPGQSFAAGRQWDARQGELSQKMKNELRSSAVQHGYKEVLRLLDA